MKFTSVRHTKFFFLFLLLHSPIFGQNTTDKELKMKNWYMVYSSPTDSRNLMNMTVQDTGKISLQVPDKKNQLINYQTTVLPEKIVEIKKKLNESHYKKYKSREYGQPGEASFSIGEGYGIEMPKLRTFWMADQIPEEITQLKLYLDKLAKDITLEK